MNNVLLNQNFKENPVRSDTMPPHLILATNLLDITNVWIAAFLSQQNQNALGITSRHLPHYF